MDSLSQAVLGGAVALACSGGKSTRKAIIYGAVIATLPDLDILQRFASDLESTIRHRTWSHSWLVDVGIAPLLAWLISRVEHCFSFLRWWLIVLTCLTTHSGLDGFTVYGTGLFWPLAKQNVMGGSVFIIDPLFTLPLLIALVIAWKNYNSSRAFRVTIGALVISSFYLIWGQVAQSYVEGLGKTAMQQQSKSWINLIATPTPFNSILWRVISVNKDYYYEGFYHLFQPHRPLVMVEFPRNPHLKQKIANSAEFREFEKFNHQFYALDAHQNQVITSDLRMGIEPFYFFRFTLSGVGSGKRFFDTAEGDPVIGARHFFSWLGRRLLGRTHQSLIQSTTQAPESAY